MSETTILEGLDLTKWSPTFMREFVRDSGFSPYMGSSPMEIIHVKNDLRTDGFTIRVPLVKQLKSRGVSGNQRLGGNEEQMDQYYQDVAWEYFRHAIEISKKERNKSAVNIMKEVQPLLREWASELIKYEFIENFHSMNGTNYSLSDATARNAWCAANEDRVLFGAAISNYNATHATALATIDTTNDKLTPDMITIAKRRARYARPRIRPYKLAGSGREYFVMFCHPLCFRDLKENSVMQQANREARERNVDTNPIFQDGDLIYDGVIVREMTEFYSPWDEDDTTNDETHLSGVGASSADVGVNFLCGAQSLCMANKQTPMPTSKKEDDYGYFNGIGVELAHGIEKMTWNNGSGTRKDVGVFTVYAAAEADT